MFKEATKPEESKDRMDSLSKDGRETVSRLLDHATHVFLNLRNRHEISEFYLKPAYYTQEGKPYGRRSRLVIIVATAMPFGNVLGDEKFTATHAGNEPGRATRLAPRTSAYESRETFM